MILSKILKEHRASKGWTQKDLAKFSGISLGSIKRYETNKGNITASNLEKLANAFQIPAYFLYEKMSVNQKKNVSQSKKTSFL